MAYKRSRRLCIQIRRRVLPSELPSAKKTWAKPLRRRADRVLRCSSRPRDAHNGLLWECIPGRGCGCLSARARQDGCSAHDNGSSRAKSHAIVRTVAMYGWSRCMAPAGAGRVALPQGPIEGNHLPSESRLHSTGGAFRLHEIGRSTTWR